MTSSADRDGCTATVAGLGTAIPRFQVDNPTSARFATTTLGADATQSRTVNALYRRTGIESRGSVLLDEAPGNEITSDFYPPAISPEDRGPSTKRRGQRFEIEAPILAAEASRAALHNGGVDAAEITHLVTVTCTGFTAPGIDIELMDQLGLPPTTQRVQVGFMGCHGAINGLRTARGLLADHDQARVLVSCVELCSLHYQYRLDADSIVSNALFADGAASMVLLSDPRDQQGLGSVAATGSYLVPDSRGAMTWKIGDHGYEMTLSAQVPSLIEQKLAPFLTTWLEAHGETIGSIGGWAVHPGGSRILAATESGLGLAPSALQTARRVLLDHGNMSSPTMLFILERFAERRQPKPWLMIGFGPGLEIEVALIR